MDVFQMRGIPDPVMVSVLRQQGWAPEPGTALISPQGWAGGSGGGTGGFVVHKPTLLVQRWCRVTCNRWHKGQ